MKYLKFAFGILIAGIAYPTMLVQCLLFSDGAIDSSKLFFRIFILLFFVIAGVLLILSARKKPNQS